MVNIVQLNRFLTSIISGPILPVAKAAKEVLALAAKQIPKRENGGITYEEF